MSLLTQLESRGNVTEDDRIHPVHPSSSEFPGSRAVQRRLCGLAILAFGGIWMIRPADAQPNGKPTPAATSDGRAARVKEIFRTHCLECHGGEKTYGKVKILDHEGLVNVRKVVVPKKADDSDLMRVVATDDEVRMPPPPRDRLSPAEIDEIRRWIADGAPPFPADVELPKEKQKDAAFKDQIGIDHVLRSMLAHVRKVPGEDRPYLRFFSLNHILTQGATAEELTRQRDAFFKALNHLSLEDTLYRPEPVDSPLDTVYAIDLRKVGWHVKPFVRWADRSLGASPATLFDLILLEYPFGVIHPGSVLFDNIAGEFLADANQVRPVPYLRTDWFVSVATSQPLYEDLLQLPRTLAELEQRLALDSEENVKKLRAQRAGMALSGVSRNNRVVERHPSAVGKYYWKSFDYKTSRGAENMFRDPLVLRPAGGEMIFGLPNGMQGYFVANGQGQRVDAAPTEIVTDKFASDRIVRNGLSCIRCHDQGMKEFTDTIAPAVQKLPAEPGFDKQFALRLYDGKTLDTALRRDRTLFQKSIEELLGRKPAGYEPLTPVARRYLDEPLSLGQAAGELGLAAPADLATVFRLPEFSSLGLIPLGNEGVIRRDAWEDYYDQVIRGLGLGRPIVPTDGLLRREFPSSKPAVELDLRTNHANNLFAPGDEMWIEVENKSKATASIELIGVDARGKMIVLTKPDLRVGPGKVYRFPEKGSLVVRGGLGKEQILLFGSAGQFPPGEVLRYTSDRRGYAASDRVVHPFDSLKKTDGRWEVRHPGTGLVKKQIEIETK
jgi:mono/diheme cytochrome c family protein